MAIDDFRQPAFYRGRSGPTSGTARRDGRRTHRESAQSLAVPAIELGQGVSSLVQ
jgi:hypothetical protein